MVSRQSQKSPFFRLFWGRSCEIREFHALDPDIALWKGHNHALGLKPLQDREADIALDTRPVADIANHPAEFKIDRAVAEGNTVGAGVGITCGCDIAISSRMSRTFATSEP